MTIEFIGHTGRCEFDGVVSRRSSVKYLTGTDDKPESFIVKEQMLFQNT
jgi:hypothetical protein